MQWGDVIVASMHREPVFPLSTHSEFLPLSGLIEKLKKVCALFNKKRGALCWNRNNLYWWTCNRARRGVCYLDANAQYLTLQLKQTCFNQEL